MKKKSIITPPPPMPEIGQEISGNIAISEDERKSELLKLIRKGAPSVAPKENTSLKAGAVKYTVRMPVTLNERIKQAASARMVPIAANQWIMEAIVSQLKKEGFRD